MRKEPSYCDHTYIIILVLFPASSAQYSGSVSWWMRTKPKIWSTFDEPYSSPTAKVFKHFTQNDLISNWLFHTAIVTAYFSNVVNECNPVHINVLTTIFVTVSTYHNFITLMYSLSVPQSSIYTSINPQYLSLRQLGSCLSSSSVPRSSRSASKPTLIWGFQSSTTSQLG